MMDINFSTGAEMSNLVAIPLANMRADILLNRLGDQLHDWLVVHLARTGASPHQVLMLAQALALRLPQHFRQVCRVRHHRCALLCCLRLPARIGGLNFAA